MSEQCHICGPVRHEDPTVICAPCALKAALSTSKVPMRDTRDFLIALGQSLFGPSWAPLERR